MKFYRSSVIGLKLHIFYTLSVIVLKVHIFYTFNVKHSNNESLNEIFNENELNFLN